MNWEFLGDFFVTAQGKEAPGPALPLPQRQQSHRHPAGMSPLRKTMRAPGGQLAPAAGGARGELPKSGFQSYCKCLMLL